jgi:hypothetical protein
MTAGPHDTLDLLGAYLDGIELAADILNDHDRGAHEPPPCRYAAGVKAPCSGVLCRVEWDDGELWHLCAGHTQRAQSAGLFRGPPGHGPANAMQCVSTRTARSTVTPSAPAPTTRTTPGAGAGALRRTHPVH